MADPISHNENLQQPLSVKLWSILLLYLLYNQNCVAGCFEIHSARTGMSFVWMTSTDFGVEFHF